MTLPPMERRRRATEKTLARYRKKAFDWSTGVTCIHLAWAHLRNMGRRPPSLPRFRSALAAKKALKAAGYGSVIEALDSLLPRIAPAMMTLGDIAAFKGDDGLESLRICAGPRRMFGWSEGFDEPVMIEVNAAEIEAAWRV